MTTIACVVAFIITALAVYWFLGNLISFLGVRGIFFSTIKEGQIKIVRRGGVVVRFFGRIKDHNLNEETGEITENTRLDKKTGKIIKIADEQPKGFWEKRFGVKWIGIYPWNTIYHYTFRWNKWSRLPGKTEYEIIPREETVDSVYFRAPYALLLKDLESKDRLSITAEVVLTFKMVNVRTAMFLTNDWLANAIAEATAAIRDFFGARKYNDLVVMQNEIKSKGKIGKKDISQFITAIKSLNTDAFGNDSLPKKFGPLIDDASLLSIEIGEPNGKLAEATHEKYVAERKAEVVRVAAEAEANRIRTIATAEAVGIETVAVAEATKIRLVGKQTATALELSHKALGVDGEQIGMVKLSQSIGDAKTQTVVLGGNASPILGLETKTPKVIGGKS
jgi:hypothetical protein